MADKKYQPSSLNLSSKISRRDFLKLAGVLTATGTLASRGIYLKSKKIEEKQLAPFLDPINGAKKFDKDIYDTQAELKAKGWERIVEEGFPENSFFSSTFLSFDSTFPTNSSGFYHSEAGFGEYRVDITSGHYFDYVDSKTFKMNLLKHDLLPNPFELSIDRKQFAYRRIWEDGREGGRDIAVVVSMPSVGQSRIMKLEELPILNKSLNFVKPNTINLLGKRFFSVYFTKTNSSQKKYLDSPVFMRNSKVNPILDKTIIGDNVVLDDTRMFSGSSGAGIFTQNGDFFGVHSRSPGSARFDVTRHNRNSNFDNSQIMPVSMLGKDVFWKLVDECKQEIHSYS